MRLIDADALKKALTEAHINRTLTFDIATFGCVMSAIDNAPTVETDMDFAKECYAVGYEDGKTERPQGEWIDFARWVAKEVLDDYFEESSGAFAEIACRKLVKLGLVEVKDNVYKMKGGED